MLIFQTGLMANMDTRHLLQALACEPPIMRTPVELELMRRLGVDSDIPETAEEAEARVEKSYESPLEQSEFRAQLIDEILALCDKAPARYQETKSLIAAIKLARENSYVET